MLIRPHDFPVSDEETRAFLQQHDFGQLIAPGTGREFPVVVPTHYAFEGEQKVLMHFSRMRPEGGHAAVTTGDNPYAKLFGAIAGAELTITNMRAKFKF